MSQYEGLQKQQQATARTVDKSALMENLSSATE
jgi:hypothetical protein